MQLIQKKENKIVFQAEIEESLANAIRRYVGEIPTLAITEVEISKNDSPLYDETISHRLGLIPLKTEKSMNDKTEIKLKLSSKKTGFVSSKELKGGAEVVYENMPITYLDEGQELSLSAIAKLGRGIEHSKFNPGLMFYRAISEIKMSKDFLGEIKSLFPNIEIKEKGNQIVILDNGENEISDAIESLAESKRKPIEKDFKDELIITIESFGQMDVKDIFKKSIKTLNKDLDELEKKIK